MKIGIEFERNLPGPSFDKEREKCKNQEAILNDTKDTILSIETYS